MRLPAKIKGGHLGKNATGTIIILELRKPNHIKNGKESWGRLIIMGISRHMQSSEFGFMD